MNYRFSNGVLNIQCGAIGDLLKAAADPRIISFGGGMPDDTLFPVKELREIYDSVLKNQSSIALQYGLPQGYPPLCEAIAKRMRDSGMDCEAADILILHGSQQGIDLMAKAFINPGDKIICESPTFLGALASFQPYLPQFLAVPTDDQGMRLDKLEETLAANPDAKLIYTIPEFQNPMGISMKADRRRRLLALAAQYGVVVIEDNPYREIRYEGETIPPLKCFDREDICVHLGSFSKVLAPGLRCGWAVAPKGIMPKLVDCKTSVDTQVNTLTQLSIYKYLSEYDLDAHIEDLRALYKHKKDFMRACIAKYFPSCVKCPNPEGGLFIWLEFPEGVDGAEVLKAALAKGVAFVPGQPFYIHGENINHARLNYSSSTEEKIEEGIKRLGAVLHDFCK